MSSERQPRGPNPTTVADGYSLNDQRQAITGPDLDFNYEEDYGADGAAAANARGAGGNPNAPYEGIDSHLANPDAPTLVQSHVGEHSKDFGGSETTSKIPINKSTYIWVLCAAVNSCSLGYDIGVNTGVGPLLQESMDLSDLQLEIFFGSLNLFAMIGALGANTISDQHGRRQSFIVASVFFLCGITIVVIAQNFMALMVGRVFVGLGVGFGLALDPLYIAEISPAAHRGKLVTLSEIAINVGIILGFASGLFFAKIDDDVEWRYMFGLGLLMPLVMVALARFVLPESPRWLVSRGETEKAREILRHVYPPGFDVDPVIVDMKDAIEREALLGRAIGWDTILFPKAAMRRMMLVGLGAAVAQQAVGIDAIQYFLLFILKAAGLESRVMQSWVLIFLGFLKLVFIVIGGLLLDQRGRRPMFFVSLCGMAAALLVLSVTFFGSHHSSGVAVLALAMYLSFFSLGMGPGAWLIPSEVFSNVVRAKAMSVATFLNRVVATLMSSTFLTTAKAMTWSGFFVMLSAVCFLCLAYFYFLLPETKGRSLEDMSILFAELTGDRSILDAEARIIRERESKEMTEINAPRFEPIQSPPPQTEQIKDAKVTGTMT